MPGAETTPRPSLWPTLSANAFRPTRRCGPFGYPPFGHRWLSTEMPRLPRSKSCSRPSPSSLDNIRLTLTDLVYIRIIFEVRRTWLPAKVQLQPASSRRYETTQELWGTAGQEHSPSEPLR